MGGIVVRATKYLQYFSAQFPKVAICPQACGSGKICSGLFYQEKAKFGNSKLQPDVMKFWGTLCALIKLRGSMYPSNHNYKLVAVNKRLPGSFTLLQYFNCSHTRCLLKFDDWIQNLHRVWYLEKFIMRDTCGCLVWLWPQAYSRSLWVLDKGKRGEVLETGPYLREQWTANSLSPTGNTHCVHSPRGNCQRVIKRLGQMLMNEPLYESEWCLFIIHLNNLEMNDESQQAQQIDPNYEWGLFS